MAAIETEQKLDAAKPAKEKCTVDSNFAVICAFIEQFGQITGVLCPSIGRLQVRNMKKILCICFNKRICLLISLKTTVL